MTTETGTTYQTQIPKDGLTNWEVIALAAKVCDGLQWPHTISDGTGLSAITNAWEAHGEQLLLSIDHETIHIKSECRFAETHDGGRNKENVEMRFLPAYQQLKQAIDKDDLNAAAYALEHHDRLQAEALQERIEKGELTAAEKISLGVGGHYITYGIMAINVVVFILMCISGVSLFEPTGGDILTWGGNLKAYTIGGEWWRLLSCVFVHIGIIHIAFNMYALYVIGTYLEPLLGKWKFITAYLCTGIFASLASIWWHGDTVSAGASGAIFGMYGLFLALLTTNYIDKDTRKAMLSSIGIFVGYNLLYGMKAGVDNAAHVGGLVSGFVVGYIFYYFDLKVKASVKRGTSLCIMLACATLLVSFVYLRSANDDDAKFQKTVITLGNMEVPLVDQMRRMPGMTTQNAVRVLHDSTVPGWQSFKDLADQTSSYKLSDQTKTKQDLWTRYGALRLQQSELYYKALHEDTDVYNEQLNAMNAEIEKVIEGISK